MQCVPLFSVDYAYTHLASCREIGNCDIKVVQKQLVDPVDIIFLVCPQPEQYPIPRCETVKIRTRTYTKGQLVIEKVILATGKRGRPAAKGATDCLWKPTP